MNSATYFAHPTAVIDENCQIGKEVKIWHFCHIMKGCIIGDFCNLGQNVVVSPDVVLGKGVKVQNNVSIYCQLRTIRSPNEYWTSFLDQSHSRRARIIHRLAFKPGGTSF